MPQGRNHAAACTDGEKMYVFGGRMGHNDVLEGFDDTQVLSASLCMWHDSRGSWPAKVAQL